MHLHNVFQIKHWACHSSTKQHVLVVA